MYEAEPTTDKLTRVRWEACRTSIYIERCQVTSCFALVSWWPSEAKSTLVLDWDVALLDIVLLSTDELNVYFWMYVVEFWTFFKVFRGFYRNRSLSMWYPYLLCLGRFYRLKWFYDFPYTCLIFKGSARDALTPTDWWCRLVESGPNHAMKPGQPDAVVN